MLTPHYLQKKVNIILGKLRLVEQVPDQVINEYARDDLKIVEFGNQNDEVDCLFSWFILILWARPCVVLVRRNGGLNEIRR